MENPDKQMLTAQFPDDLVEDVDEYAEKNDFSRSEAMRQLVQYGLDADPAPPTVTHRVMMFTFQSVIVSLVAVAFTLTSRLLVFAPFTSKEVATYLSGTALLVAYLSIIAAIFGVVAFALLIAIGDVTLKETRVFIGRVAREKLRGH